MIGIFDSGMGGITVLRQLRKTVPSEKFVYFGDTARVPWGNKSRKTVQNYSNEITEFLIKRGARKIVIACNTASALAASYLRNKHPSVIFYDVISPCVTAIVQKAPKSVLILGTRATIQSNAYEQLLRKNGYEGKVYSHACPLFVPFIEEGMQNDRILIDVANKYLAKYKKHRISQVVLGCTHYPMIRKTLRNVFGKKAIMVDSANEIAKTVKNDLGGIRANKEHKDVLYFSDWNKRNEEFVKKLVKDNYSVKIHRF